MVMLLFGIPQKEYYGEKLASLYDNFKYQKIEQVLGFQKIAITPDGFSLPLRAMK